MIPSFLPAPTSATHHLLAVLLILTPGAAPLRSTAATSRNPTPLDSLWLRQGDPSSGTLENPTLTVQTPYAQIQFPTDQITQVLFAVGPHQLDQITTAHSNRVSGFVLDDPLYYRPRIGSRLTLRRDQISRLNLHRAEPHTAPPASSRQIFLRNGDWLTGQFLGPALHLDTPQATVTIPWNDIQSITITDAEPVLASLRTRDQGILEGTWPDPVLTLTLDDGPTLSLYAGRIEAIDAQPPTQSDAPNGQPAARPPPDPQAPPSPSPNLVWIPPGTFVMGSPAEEPDRDLDEGPLTRVTLSQGFFISTHEVTQAEYQAVMQTNPSLFIGDSRRPVEKVRYRDALEYCRRLTEQHQTESRLPEGYAYRLPTEAEWEYACRAQTTTRFSHGTDPQGYNLEAYAWFNTNSDSTTHAVGTRKPNPWGLYDMGGNVLEWCLDGATGTLPGGDVQDPFSPAEGLLRIARGGSWLHGARACRSANRDSYGESTRSSDLGFRIVLSATHP